MNEVRLLWFCISCCSMKMPSRSRQPVGWTNSLQVLKSVSNSFSQRGLVPLPIFTAARMLSSVHKLPLILTWYDFLRPYCSSPAVSRYSLTGTARVNVGTVSTMHFRIPIVVIRSSGDAWMFLFRSGRNYPLPL